MWTLAAFMVCIGVVPAQPPGCPVYAITGGERPTEFVTEAECRAAGKTLADELTAMLQEELGPVPVSIGIRCVPPASHGMVAT